MYFKVELLRVWEDGTWDLDTMSIDPEEQPENYLVQFENRSEVWMDQIEFHYMENYQGEKSGLYAVQVMTAWQEPGHVDRLGNYIYAGGNLAQSDANTLKLMFGRKDKSHATD